MHVQIDVSEISPQACFLPVLLNVDLATGHCKTLLHESSKIEMAAGQVAS
jgi:hypothetical protein